jgi:hypothetical protein
MRDGRGDYENGMHDHMPPPPLPLREQRAGRCGVRCLGPQSVQNGCIQVLQSISEHTIVFETDTKDPDEKGFSYAFL